MGFKFFSASLASSLRVYFKYRNDQWDKEVTGSWDPSAETVGGRGEKGRASTAKNRPEVAEDPEAAENF